MPGINVIKISTLLYFFLLITIAVSCQKKETNPFVKIRTLPNTVHEVSGITTLPDTNLYAINDSGNDNTLFSIHRKGKIVT